MSHPDPGEVLEVVNGAVRAVLDRAAELGVEVTAEQVARNVLPNVGQVAADLLAHAREHGSLDGVQLGFASAADAADVDEWEA